MPVLFGTGWITLASARWFSNSDRRFLFSLHFVCSGVVFFFFNEILVSCVVVCVCWNISSTLLHFDDHVQDYIGFRFLMLN